MRIEQLLYLQAIVKAQSFSAAAETLFISQGALSKSIKALEDELHTQMLIRKKDQVTLTPIGTILYDNFEKIIENYTAVMRTTEMYHYNDTMKLGVLHYLSYTPLYESIMKYEKISTNFTLETHECTHRKMFHGVLSGALDCCIGYRELWPIDRSISYITLYSEPLAVVSTISNEPDIAEYSFPALANKQFCFVREDSDIFKFILNSFNDKGLFPHITLSEVRLETIKKYISAGIRSTVHGKSIAASMFPSSMFTVSDIEDAPALTLTLAYNKSQLNARTADFIRYVCEVYNLEANIN